MTMSSGKPGAKTKKFADQIRKCALSYPDSKEDFPWGHSAFKVKAKTFVFMGADDTGLSISVKLDASHFMALQLPFTEPTHYGLGKHGWVSAQFAPNAAVPIDMLEDWIAESFRAIAPKTILKKLEQGSAEGGTQKKAVKKVVAKKKTVKKAVKKKTKSR